MSAFYLKKFEIRWSDVDANRHLANSAYITFMSHTRMSFFTENGFGQMEMAKHAIGPVITYERIHYFKEVLPDHPIWVSISLKGISTDASVFKFVHRFYNRAGKNLAYCEMMGTWINLNTRKMTPPPSELLHLIEALHHEEDFENLTIADLRSPDAKPIPLEGEID